MSDQNAIVLKSQIINSYSDLERAAGAMSKSGYFQDSQQQAQAVVKIMAGQEMGFGPFASMTGVYIIKGKPSIGANLMAAAVKGSGRYNYRVTEISDKACTIDFYEGKEKIGTSTFTIEDARRAETQNTQKFPRNMLFARAMSNGVKWYCPDIFNGAPVYTPEELGADVDNDGNVINSTFVEEKPEISPTNGNGHKAEAVVYSKPYDEKIKVTFSESELSELELAMGELDSSGKPYGEMGMPELMGHLNNLSQRNPKTDEDKLKIKAINTIRHYVVDKKMLDADPTKRAAQLTQNLGGIDAG